MVRFETPYNKQTTPPHHDGVVSSSGGSSTAGAKSWNSWWSRRSPNIKTNDNPPVRIGIDAGSKTLKLVALDANGDVVFADYHRHRSDVRASLADLLHDVVWRRGDMTLPLAFTGSAGIALAQMLGVPFVQEVVAATNAVKARYPQADCIVELGGEDAKITYLTGVPEHRMNATCAGGTGDFIDGIASMLGCKTREISKLALGAQRTYPIASRCAVFARTDVRPLINAGARKADIAQSALEAVVRQTLGGLACGRPIRGTVVFLGGPLEHIPALVMTFRRMLDLTPQTGIKPPDAHLYCAIGAIETADNPPALTLSELERRLRTMEAPEDETGAFPPLFQTEEERAAFTKRHAASQVQPKRIENARGPLYLGFDAGSTTMKYVLTDEAGDIVASDYQTVEGDTLATARAMIEQLLLALQGGEYGKADRYLARAVVTGYGEDLLREAFGFDDGVVETVAHLRAAQHYVPDASFVLDIGGQDMKALWVRDGQVTDAVLNEACSSGCGAFVQSSAKSLNLSQEDFTSAALAARHPIDLGAKCTVFMTSRVRHAQKAGADVGDIAAGIAYSVVNNALTRIIGADRAATLGDKVVVQGGAFKSDAVLRAFEKVTGVNVIRPTTAHLMGAYGASLIARDGASLDAQSAPVSGGLRSEVRCTPENGGTSGTQEGPVSAQVQKCVTNTSTADTSFVSLEQVQAMNPQRQTMRCTGCGNACLLSVVDFGNGRRFISGNRCERAAAVMFDETPQVTGHAPNVVALEQKLLEGFGDVSATGPRGGFTIGLMNVLNTYESLPFWHTLLATLGFSVVVPDDARAARLQERAAETIPSESVCHPAKMAHLRYVDLEAAGASCVFMPRFERGTRCPVACLYADALAANTDGPQVISPTLRSIHPRGIASRPEDQQALLTAFGNLLPPELAITSDELAQAMQTALDAQDAFEGKIQKAGEAAYAWTAEDPARRMAIIAGRPYHADPALLHDIDRILANLGFAVVPLLGIPRERGQQTLWKPSRRLVGLVSQFADDPQVEIVALRSFGCGYDAVSFDEARELASQLHRPFTELKIDDIADTAHIRIRLRTLAYTSKARSANAQTVIPGRPLRRDPSPSAHDDNEGRSLGGCITPDLCSTAKALVEAAAADALQSPGAARLQVPDVCKDCLTDALPLELHQLLGAAPEIQKVPAASREERPESDGLKVGLLGNPLLVFNPDLNDHVEDLLHELECSVVYPDPELVAVEDVRYLEQLERFRQQGVQRVIYLQSFGCLKGHVQSRGALRDLARRFPEMPITVVDYDPESSALNRENRIRLAVSA